MTSPVVGFYLTCLVLWKTAQMADLKSSPTFHHSTDFVPVDVGAEVTLQCFHESDIASYLYWFKHILGQKPRLISSLNQYNQMISFDDEFKNSSRFTVTAENGKNHLTITNIDISDSATYYCLSANFNNIEFKEIIIVSVKGSGLNVPTLVHQSVSETIHPGDSVMLNCTVHTRTCDKEHSVYWFRNSEESHPGILYTHGDRSNQCERNSEKQTHTCVYNLSMKNLTRSHVGTYYCAVASCGHILFGNGTKLDIEGEGISYGLVYFLSGALSFTTILLLLLTYLLYKRSKYQPTELQTRFSAPSATNSEVYQDDNLQYAAINVHLSNISRQRNETNTECVYSRVKL
ncbi:immunoglobulin kappa light chain-like [Channa argus]|uniref:immunoglobulin kappa light chain-like n=1 Tax=Channa argus TaxID=215402 RepID=UPI0035211F96